MLKGPKRSFTVVLVLGVESSSKNVAKGTKNFREQNLFQLEQNMFQKEQRMFAIKVAPN